MGFAGGFRRSELAAIDVEDLEDHPAGLLVWLRHSKTDQEKAGRRIEVVYGSDGATCPVRAARRWLQLSQLSSGPLLRTIDRHGNISARRLSGQAVGMVVKRHMSRLGYDSQDFAGHSLRRGMATTAARNGAAERTIMRTTGHTATETLRGYITEAEAFTDPSVGLPRATSGSEVTAPPTRWPRRAAATFSLVDRPHAGTGQPPKIA
jgi:site-specific recombinase XerD